MNSYVDHAASQDFNKARGQETFSRIVNLLDPGSDEMLSLQEVRDLLRPKNETYRGMQTVSIDLIVGSEGRYRDFNRRFLPKHEYLRNRWTRVDKAHLESVILPPIKLYEIGGVYFVRDGNHRVSVARSQGVKAIDAEVVSLSSEVSLRPNMNKRELLHQVINYEKQRFYEKMQFDRLLPHQEIVFTAPGRYDEVIQHIYGHKYYINQHYQNEIPVETAVISWFNNVYRPIVNIIEQEGLLHRFPGRTAADLYVWIVKHWHELKEQNGPNVSVQAAVEDYSRRYGKDIRQRMRDNFERIFRRKNPVGDIQD